MVQLCSCMPGRHRLPAPFRKSSSAYGRPERASLRWRSWPNLALRRFKREEKRKLPIEISRQEVPAVLRRHQEGDRPLAERELVQKLDPKACSRECRHDLAQPVVPVILDFLVDPS